MINTHYMISFLVIVAFIVAIYYITKRKTTQSDKIRNNNNKSNYSLDNIENFKNRNFPYNPSIEREILPPTIKKNFINIQFHNDYRDVQTAFNNMVPSNKQIFNVSNRPVKYSEPDERAVIDLVKQFIENLKKEVAQVPDVRNENSGWDEAISDRNVESGWERQRKALGLEVSLYPKPLGKTDIDLVAIEKVQKYESEEETKFTIQMILQKDRAEDQIVLKVSFVVFTEMLNDENRLFENGEIDVHVVLEDINIVGFLSDYGQDMTKQYELTKSKQADFRSLENQNLTSDKDIMKELGKHYERVRREMEMRNSTLDEDGRDAHNSTPNLLGYDSYRVTQTIEDDMCGRNRNFV